MSAFLLSMQVAMPAPYQREAWLDGVYRYSLLRAWDDSRPRAAFIMLNPSDADHRRDDRTVGRLLYFAQAWGYGSFEIGNLYAYRTPYPTELARAHAERVDVVGPRNAEALTGIIERAHLVVAAWGSHYMATFGRGEDVLDAYPHVRWHCIRHTPKGAPQHPLRIPKSARPQIYREGKP